MIFSKSCLICDSKLNTDSFLCSECIRKIKNLSSFKKCALCNRKIDNENEYLCVYCKKTNPAFDQAIAVYNYEGSFRKLLVKMKFRHNYHYVKNVGEMMAEQFEKLHVSCDIVVPVPTRIANYFDRDYCTACELSYIIGKKLGIKVYDSVLSKKKREQQSVVPFEKRYENVKGAFDFSKRYKKIICNKNILLVDDVLTTGSTASECAGVLKNNGASRVYLLTFLYGGK